MNVIYILFKENLEWWSAPFVIGVYENEEDAYDRKAQMFDSEKYVVEEWEIQ